MLDFPLMLWVKLFVDKIHAQIKVMSVESKAILYSVGDNRKLIDSPELHVRVFKAP